MHVTGQLHIFWIQFLRNNKCQRYKTGKIIFHETRKHVFLFNNLLAKIVCLDKLERQVYEKNANIMSKYAAAGLFEM